MTTPTRRAPRHHWVVRVTHWIAVLAIVVMVGSGLRIFNAYPGFARRGERFCCYPFEGRPIPDVLTGGDHAKVRAWRAAESERITRQRRPDLWGARRDRRES